MEGMEFLDGMEEKENRYIFVRVCAFLYRCTSMSFYCCLMSHWGQGGLKLIYLFSNNYASIHIILLCQQTGCSIKS